MSKKDINQLNIYNKNVDNKKHKLDKNLQQKGKLLQNYIGKRKRTTSNKELLCYNCKSTKNFDIYKFNNINFFIESINKKFNINNELKNKTQLIQQIPGTFKKPIIICNKCFEEIIMHEDCVNIIKKIFFDNKGKRLNKKLSLQFNNSNSEVNFTNNIIKEENTLVKITQKTVNKNYIKEYEECFQNIVQYLKMTVLEVSFFSRSFKNYVNNINIIFHYNLNIKFIFDSYFHTKISLENLYLLINKILIKYQEITNKIIFSLNLGISYNSDEDFKSNYKKFIYNTNLILANLLNLVNNFNIFMDVLNCSSNYEEKENNIK